MALPTDDGFFMPAEWADHVRCWMAWPCREDLWGDHLEDARDTFADVAKAIARFEPVTIIANPESVAEVSLKCGSAIACLPLEHDDSWIRDNGPTFVVDGKGGVAGIDWRFNGWGNKYHPHDRDDQVAEAMLDQLAVKRYDAPLVLEGGSIHVDGEGTLITTEQCLLNTNRNPELDRGQLEQALADYLGVRKIIWLHRGLHDDETDGHVDNVACFVKPGAVLALSSSDKGDANYDSLQENVERLRQSSDAMGRDLEVITVEQPAPRRGATGMRLPLSYISFYLANGGVIMPSFEDANDEDAYETIAGCFPGRKVAQVSCLDLVRGGGGIHAVTQQQPRA